jgi:hypothetical protein
MYFRDRRQSAVPLFSCARILPIYHLYTEHAANMMLDISNNKVPSNISSLFKTVRQIHSYNTRASAAQNLYIKHSRTNILKNSFSRVGAKLWNQIPQDIKNLSKQLFKKKMKKSLFDRLAIDGYDVEFSNLFKPFK